MPIYHAAGVSVKLLVSPFEDSNPPSLPVEPDGTASTTAVEAGAVTSYTEVLSEERIALREEEDDGHLRFLGNSTKTPFFCVRAGRKKPLQRPSAEAGFQTSTAGLTPCSDETHITSVPSTTSNKRKRPSKATPAQKGSGEPAGHSASLPAAPNNVVSEQTPTANGILRNDKKDEFLLPTTPASKATVTKRTASTTSAPHSSLTALEPTLPFKSIAIPSTTGFWNLSLAVTFEGSKAFQRSRENVSEQDLKISVFFNGELASCAMAHAKHCRGQKTVLSGRRVGRLKESAWLLVVPNTRQHVGTDLNDALPNDLRTGVERRWDEICAALRHEAELLGFNKAGGRPPSADVLRSLSEMPMPESVEAMQTRRGLKLGVIDVVMTLGSGTKVATTAGWLSKPEHLVDEDFGGPQDDIHEPSRGPSLQQATAKRSQQHPPGPKQSGRRPATTTRTSSKQQTARNQPLAKCTADLEALATPSNANRSRKRRSAQCATDSSPMPSTLPSLHRSVSQSTRPGSVESGLPSSPRQQWATWGQPTTGFNHIERDGIGRAMFTPAPATRDACRAMPAHFIPYSPYGIPPMMVSPSGAWEQAMSPRNFVTGISHPTMETPLPSPAFQRMPAPFYPHVYPHFIHYNPSQSYGHSPSPYLAGPMRLPTISTFQSPISNSYVPFSPGTALNPPSGPSVVEQQHYQDRPQNALAMTTGTDTLGHNSSSPLQRVPLVRKLGRSPFTERDVTGLRKRIEMWDPADSSKEPPGTLDQGGPSKNLDAFHSRKLALNLRGGAVSKQKKSKSASDDANACNTGSVSATGSGQAKNQRRRRTMASLGSEDDSVAHATSDAYRSTNGALMSATPQSTDTSSIASRLKRESDGECRNVALPELSRGCVITYGDLLQPQLRSPNDDTLEKARSFGTRRMRQERRGQFKESEVLLSVRFLVAADFALEFQ